MRLRLRQIQLTRFFTIFAIAFLMAGAPRMAAAAPESFADLAEQLTPAVVNISTTQTVESGPFPGGRRPELPEGSPFEKYFKDFYDRHGGGGPRMVNSLGSGFVIDPEGYIVTNNHVIDKADEIVVGFSDGTSLKAELIGTDPKTDIALLKVVPAEPLVFVPFGDSDRARVGEWVMAIGNPLGLGGSVSVGIISARNRDIDSGPYDDFIQTDAAINKGNSGGPLFNMDGEVVGVNTAIFSQTGGSIGIGFSVPSKLVKTVVSQLREHGRTRRGWLGVRIQPVDEGIAESVGLDEPRGAMVNAVTPEGPAAKGGLAAGDIILKFDGADVAEMKDLPSMVAQTEVGKDVRVVVWRKGKGQGKGKTQTLKVVLGLLDEGPTPAPAQVDKPEEPQEAETALGMRLEPLTDANRGDYDVADGVEGVLITEVDGGSAAAQKGLRPGDVIVEVAQEKVLTPAEVKGGVAQAKEEDRKSVLMLVQSGADLRFVALKVE